MLGRAGEGDHAAELVLAGWSSHQVSWQACGLAVCEWERAWLLVWAYDSLCGRELGAGRLESHAVIGVGSQVVGLGMAMQ